MRNLNPKRVLPFVLSFGLLVTALTAAVSFAKAGFEDPLAGGPVSTPQDSVLEEKAAPEPTDKSMNPNATVDDLGWMSGTWHGEIFGSPIQEQWHAPKDGVILGTSRMGTDPARTTYEFLLIEEKNGVPTMFLRHFKQYLSSDEKAPMEYSLTRIDNKKAVFETSDKSLSFTRITYQAEGRNTLVVTLDGESGDKPMRIECRMSKKIKK